MHSTVTSPSNSTAILRRRAKRRHLSSSALDLRDPFEIVALAVRFDESRQDESLLKVPLESGRLYDSQQFKQVLEFLLQETQAPSRLSPQKRRLLSFGSRKQQGKPAFALTPIILSGLLSVVQQQREEAEQKGEENLEDTASELVGACRTMRHAALSRIRFKKQRHRVQRIVLPVFSLSVLVLLYVRYIADTRRIIDQLGFVDSCRSGSNNSIHYTEICRLSDAVLWAKYREYLLTLDEPCLSPSECRHTLLEGRYHESPFTLHTSLSQNLLRYEEVNRPFVSSTRATVPSQHRTSSNIPDHRWLGESAVNQLVRQALNDYLPKQDPKILDVGCGVGGTLFSLLPAAFTRKRFQYHGITSNGAEILFAERLLEYHGLNHIDGIRFEERNYDDALPARSYNLVVAIESLSYSSDLEFSLRNLLQSLQKGGFLLVVDDVLAVEQEQYEARSRIDAKYSELQPSLVPHKTWKSFLEKLGCKIQVARDLSLEYELTNLSYRLDWDVFPQWQAFLQPAERLLVSLFGRKKETQGPASRLLELTKDRHKLTELMSRRYAALQHAVLSYNLYVCKKER